MAGITNYSQNQFQYFYKRVAKPSGASGTEIVTWAASGVSGMSNISSTSYVSGASGVSGFTVEGLTFNEVVELFTEGNLSVGEVEKWLNANHIEFQFTDNGKIVNFKFTHNNKSYDISCNKKAAASQLDNITQNTYYKSQIDGLRGKYELTDEEISKYFLVGTSYNGNVSMYMINPDCGCKNWNEVVDAIKAEKETPAADTFGESEDIGTPAAGRSTSRRAPGNTQYAKGDVNHDGVVDVADISAIINAMAEDETNTQYDVNGDGVVNIADISAVNTIMANGNDDKEGLTDSEKAQALKDLANKINGGVYSIFVVLAKSLYGNYGDENKAKLYDLFAKNGILELLEEVSKFELPQNTSFTSNLNNWYKSIQNFNEDSIITGIKEIIWNCINDAIKPEDVFENADISFISRCITLLNDHWMWDSYEPNPNDKNTFIIKFTYGVNDTKYLKVSGKDADTWLEIGEKLFDPVKYAKELEEYRNKIDNYSQYDSETQSYIDEILLKAIKNKDDWDDEKLINKVNNLIEATKSERQDFGPELMNEYIAKLNSIFGGNEDRGFQAEIANYLIDYTNLKISESYFEKTLQDKFKNKLKEYADGIIDSYAKQLEENKETEFRTQVKDIEEQFQKGKLKADGNKPIAEVFNDLIQSIYNDIIKSTLPETDVSVTTYTYADVRGLTPNDISLYLEKDNETNTYTLNQNAIENTFGKGINTIDDLLNATSARDANWIIDFFTNSKNHFLPKSFIDKIAKKYYGDGYSANNNNAQIKSIAEWVINWISGPENDNLYDKLSNADEKFKQAISNALVNYNINGLDIHGNNFKNGIKAIFTNVYAEAEAKVKAEAEAKAKAEAEAKVQAWQELMTKLMNQEFDSLESLETACGGKYNQLNINQVYSDSKYKYYKVEVKGLNISASVKVKKQTQAPQPATEEEMKALVTNYDKLDDTSKKAVDDLIQTAIDNKWTKTQFKTKLDNLTLIEKVEEPSPATEDDNVVLSGGQISVKEYGYIVPQFKKYFKEVKNENGDVIGYEFRLSEMNYNSWLKDIGQTSMNIILRKYFSSDGNNRYKLKDGINILDLFTDKMLASNLYLYNYSLDAADENDKLYANIKNAIEMYIHQGEIKEKLNNSNVDWNNIQNLIASSFGNDVYYALSDNEFREELEYKIADLIQDLRLFDDFNIEDYLKKASWYGYESSFYEEADSEISSEQALEKLKQVLTNSLSSYLSEQIDKALTPLKSSAVSTCDKVIKKEGRGDSVIVFNAKNVDIDFTVRYVLNQLEYYDQNYLLEYGKDALKKVVQIIKSEGVDSQFTVQDLHTYIVGYVNSYMDTLKQYTNNDIEPNTLDEYKKTLFATKYPDTLKNNITETDLKVIKVVTRRLLAGMNFDIDKINATLDGLDITTLVTTILNSNTSEMSLYGVAKELANAVGVSLSTTSAEFIKEGIDNIVYLTNVVNIEYNFITQNIRNGVSFSLIDLYKHLSETYPDITIDDVRTSASLTLYLMLNKFGLLDTDNTGLQDAINKFLAGECVLFNITIPTGPVTRSGSNGSSTYEQVFGTEDVAQALQVTSANTTTAQTSSTSNPAPYTTYYEEGSMARTICDYIWSDAHNYVSLANVPGVTLTQEPSFTPSFLALCGYIEGLDLVSTLANAENYDGDIDKPLVQWTEYDIEAYIQAKAEEMGGLLELDKVMIRQNIEAQIKDAKDTLNKHKQELKEQNGDDYDTDPTFRQNLKDDVKDHPVNARAGGNGGGGSGSSSTGDGNGKNWVTVNPSSPDFEPFILPDNAIDIEALIQQYARRVYFSNIAGDLYDSAMVAVQQKLYKEANSLNISNYDKRVACQNIGYYFGITVTGHTKNSYGAGTAYTEFTPAEIEEAVKNCKSAEEIQNALKNLKHFCMIEIPDYDNATIEVKENNDPNTQGTSFEIKVPTKLVFITVNALGEVSTQQMNLSQALS